MTVAFGARPVVELSPSPPRRSLTKVEGGRALEHAEEVLPPEEHELALPPETTNPPPAPARRTVGVETKGSPGAGSGRFAEACKADEFPDKVDRITTAVLERARQTGRLPRGVSTVGDGDTVVERRANLLDYEGTGALVTLDGGRVITAKIVDFEYEEQGDEDHLFPFVLPAPEDRKALEEAVLDPARSGPIKLLLGPHGYAKYLDSEICYAVPEGWVRAPGPPRIYPVQHELPRGSGGRDVTAPPHAQGSSPVPAAEPAQTPSPARAAASTALPSSRSGRETPPRPVLALKTDVPPSAEPPQDTGCCAIS